MGRLLDAAIDRAGLADIAARALSGETLTEADLARLRAADVLVVAGLADAVRARHRGGDVRLFGSDSVRRASDVLRVELVTSGAEGPTGQELLLKVAMARLAAPADKSIAVSYEQIGIELAQTALAFGADALIGDLSTKRTLPLLDGPAARREEITGLIERAGRRVRFVDDPISASMDDAVIASMDDAVIASMESRS
jgi:2-iminoacetate synthase ThiH